MRTSSLIQPTGKTILVIDDDIDILDSLSGTLKKEGHDVITTADGIKALEYLKNNKIDLVVTDYRMPVMNGDILIRKIREFSDVVIILQTGFSEDYPQVEMMKELQIHAYYNKGEGTEAFLSTVIGALRFSEKLDEVKKLNVSLDELVKERTRHLEDALHELKIKNTKLEEAYNVIDLKEKETEKLNFQLQKLAYLDGLTGAYNRTFMNIYIQKQIDLTNKQLTFGQDRFKDVNNFGVILMDIDNFKNYNDNNGHLEGDYLLKKLVDIIQENVFEPDIVCRYGGEEFLVICPQTPKSGIIRAAEKLLKKIEEYPFPNGEKQPLGKVTVSIGLGFYPSDSPSLCFEELLNSADKRLYAAKRSGKNKICYED